MLIKSTPACSVVAISLDITITVSTIFPIPNFAKCAIYYPVILPDELNTNIVSEPDVVTVGEPVVVPV